MPAPPWPSPAPAGRACHATLESIMTLAGAVNQRDYLSEGRTAPKTWASARAVPWMRSSRPSRKNPIPPHNIHQSVLRRPRHGLSPTNLLFLSKQDVDALITPEDVFAAVESVFRADGMGQVLSPVKADARRGRRRPLRHAGPPGDAGVAGVKWTNFCPNQPQGLPRLLGACAGPQQHRDRTALRRDGRHHHHQPAHRRGYTVAAAVSGQPRRRTMGC